MYMGNFRSAKCSPKEARSIGLKLDKENALKLATALLEYTQVDTNGLITITVQNDPDNGNVNESGIVSILLVQGDRELPRNYKTYINS